MREKLLWLYLPESEEKPPVIVMDHGLGGVREMRLDAYAEKFADAGYACFLFDYRNYGASEGKKRQLINVKDQFVDWENAIYFIKKDNRVDGNQILLFGTSFSGGHVITLSSRRQDILAAVCQCPYTNTSATLNTARPLSSLKIFPLVVADILSSFTGYHPIMLKLSGAPGEAAIMAVPDYKSYLQQVLQHSYFVNKAPARTILEFLKYSPGKYTKNIENPIFYAVCLKDTVAPAEATLKYAKRSERGMIKSYDCGHFDIYFGNYFEIASEDYIVFFDNYAKKP